jgi:hypothetical protein
MKPVKEEWDQSDLRFASYDQNSHQTLLLKLSGGHVRPWTGYVRSRPNILEKGVYVWSTQKLSSQL